MKPPFFVSSGIVLAALVAPTLVLGAQDAATRADGANNLPAAPSSNGAPNNAVPAVPPAPAPQAVAPEPVPASHNRLPVPKGDRPTDPRLQFRHYDPHRIIRMDGRANVQASIVFDEDERIENVAVGDANSWQVTPSKRANLLFVKPLDLRARTNMTVVTDQRTYLFDLVAGTGATPVYMLRFIYPEPKLPKAEPSMMSEAEVQALTLKAVPEIAKPNFGWTQKGSSALFPVRLYDLAGSTYLAWAPTRPIPAILTRDSKDAEGLVNYAVQNGEIVMDTVPSEIILRLGRDKAVLTRNNLPSSPVLPEPLKDAGSLPHGQAGKEGM